MAWKAGSQTGKKVTARKDIWWMMQEALLAPSIGESMGRTKKQLTGGTCPFVFTFTYFATAGWD